MKITLFLVIFLSGVECLAQNNRSIAQNRHSSSRFNVSRANRTEIESMIQSKAYSGLKKKLPGTYSHPKQKLLTQLMDSVYMWRWDTNGTDWALDYKYSVEQFDANDNPLAELGQNWDGSAWVFSDRTFYTYDDKNNPLNEVWHIWTGTDWENDQRGSYEYDANNNLLTELVEYGDGDNWVNSMLITNTYDANNNKTSYLHQNWNGNEWENYWQETYTYDVKNNITSEIHQDWIDNQWVDNGQNTYVYDVNNNLISSLTQVDNGAELVTSEVTYFYDAGNRLVSDSAYTWGNSWDYIHLRTYTYDSFGNLINWLSQSKNGENLENLARAIFTYDAANNETSAFRQDWKDNSWVNFDFDSHSFNEYNLLTSDTYRYWNSSGTKVMDGDSLAYYYHDAVTGLNEIERARENICIYPNPNRGKFILTSNSNIQSIVIFNINGKLIYSDSGLILQMQKEIDLSNYDKGVYLLKIQTITGVETKKLFIQ
jgi:hypothetical protein